MAPWDGIWVSFIPMSSPPFTPPHSLHSRHTDERPLSLLSSPVSSALTCQLSVWLLHLSFRPFLKYTFSVILSLKTPFISATLCILCNHLYLQSIQISAFSISAWSPLKQSPDKSLHTELIWEFNPRGAEGQGQVKERGKKGRASKDAQSRWLSPWCFWMPLGEHLGSGYQNYTPSGINKKHLLTPSCLHFGVMHLLKIPWAARR